jgi:hypothetical protein
MKREAAIAEKIVGNFLAAYPDSSPTEQDRKKWREEGAKRRKKEGIKPRRGTQIF